MGIIIYLYIAVVIVIIAWVISFFLLDTYKPLQKICILFTFICISVVLAWPITFLSIIPTYEIIQIEPLKLGMLIIIFMITILNVIIFPIMFSRLLDLYKKEKISFLKAILWILVCLALYTVILSIVIYCLI